MKRPPGLWLLLTIVAVWLKVEDVYSLKATALIFGKTSTTTTTTVAPDVSESASEEGVTEASSSSSNPDGENSTKPQLTGNPQIDYIWDPNLPRELNGYNLSDYPFYHRIPKDIDFKCDGLHDGFYASVPHKCQVYHHCLFGVRYDFLCANYTAFDQKTFICHFVSEVDCLNSKKFWHRNDALYKAASTTTVKPTPVYTLPPPAATPVPIVPILSRRPERPRRPPARRRPYDYYEDEYEDDVYYEKPMRRPRPRYRPRVYDDEYDYEEEDYAPRPMGRRNEPRRPYKSRGPNRRRPYDDEEYKDEDDTRRPDNSRRNNDDTRRPSKRRPVEDDEYDRRTYDRPRKKGYRRPIDDEYEDDPPPRRSSDRRKNKNREDSRKYGDEEEEDRPRKSSRKNADRTRDDEEEDVPRNRNDKDRDRERNRNDEVSNDDRSSKNNDKSKTDDASYDDRPLTKPPSSIYNRRRPLVSKIRPPVPSHEQAKYSPKVPKTTTPEPIDEEYYDDYEEDLEKKEESRRSYKDSNRKSVSTTQSSSSTRRGNEGKRKEDDYEAAVEVDTSTRRYNKRPLNNDELFGTKERRNNLNNRRRPVLVEYDDEETNIQTTTTTKEPPKEPLVKIVKRPFLPSRGGNPYAPRGLLPVGSKASDSSDVDQNDSADSQNSRTRGEQTEERELPKQSPVVVKIPVRNKYVNSDEEFRPISNRPVTRIVKLTTTTTTTTEKPKVIEKDPLDEYDVTLNDALNPTLPNLPVRSFPTGFSSQNDYTYNTVQRPRYVIDPVINQASSDYVYRIEQPETISNNIRYRSIPVYQNFRQSPKVTQAFYTPY